ncbi:flagellar hook-length control protein FliK [Calidifontibacillus erzurumensis]|uniref:flagellar hook-length control protein FliK n=1 Tax=Calidifontibacillus erzurumensis TaxID=2741433 RepID=UPI0035B53C41
MNAQGLGVIGYTIRSQVEKQTNYEAGNQKGNQLSFLDLLNNEMSSTPLSTSMAASNSEGGIFDGQGNDSFLNEELLAFFQQLIETMPQDEQFIDPAIIQQPEWEKLMMGLPQNVVEQLTNAILSGKSIGQILGQTQVGSKEQFAVVLAVLYQMKDKNMLPESQWKAFEEQLSKQMKENAPLNGQSTSHLPLLTKKTDKDARERLNGLNLEQASVSRNLERRPFAQRTLQSSPTSSTTTKTENGQMKLSFIDPLGEKAKIDSFENLIVGSMKESTPISRFQQLVVSFQPNYAPTYEDQILQQLQQIMKNSKFTTMPNGTSQIQVKLSPEHLGMLTIKLTETNGEMIARIIASTVQAKEVIEKNLQVLRHAFAVQNIQAEKFEVLYQGESQFNGTNKEYSGEQGEGKKQQEQKASNDYHEDDKSESQSFLDELLNVIV